MIQFAGLPLSSMNTLYYSVKPFLPLAVRLAIKRQRAALRRRAYADVWPIDQNAGTVPLGWPGWPEGKRFAFVLTHDVEGSRGYGKVESLMELELQHGFRSSFNLVPEGQYQVSEGLRRVLAQNGFEIGVHGLHHDGRLYSSKTEFSHRAKAIRHYLREWNACGFRSPYMHHRLAWLHELGLEYDCSTFDTDPFEPQADGVGTVFPFWVPGPNGSGYVELPYTLVQDSTLFPILRESTIEIWERKLDWIAERGGLALLVHTRTICASARVKYGLTNIRSHTTNNFCVMRGSDTEMPSGLLLRVKLHGTTVPRCQWRNGTHGSESAWLRILGTSQTAASVIMQRPWRRGEITSTS